MNVVDAALNTVLVSIPEEFMLSIIILIFMRRFDLLDYKQLKYNLSQIMIPVIPTAFISNILRYINNITSYDYDFVVSITQILLFIAMMCYMLERNNLLKTKHLKMKTVLFTLLGIAIIVITELMYFPFIPNFLQIKNSTNPYIIFMYSLPSRIFQLIFVSFIILYKNEKFDFKVVKYILKDKITSIISIAFTSVIVIVWLIIISIYRNSNTDSIPMIKQIALNSFILIIPTILLWLFFMIINYYIQKIISLQKLHKQMIDQIEAE